MHTCTCAHTQNDIQTHSLIRSLAQGKLCTNTPIRHFKHFAFFCCFKPWMRTGIVFSWGGTPGQIQGDRRRRPAYGAEVQATQLVCVKGDFPAEKLTQDIVNSWFKPDRGRAHAWVSVRCGGITYRICLQFLCLFAFVQSTTF